MDPYWELDRSQQQKLLQEDQLWTSTRNEQNYQEYIPMEEGEICSNKDQNPSILEVPAVNWAKYEAVKSALFVKMGHASKIDAEEPNSWDLGNAVRETEKVLLYGSAIINDRNDKRPFLSRMPAARKLSQRVNSVQKEAFQKVRAGV